MTDGIIQEVFDKYRIAEPYVLDNGVRVYSRFPVEKLQQELIEKIRQDFPITEPFLHVYGAKRVRRMLIGDNQE